MVENVARCCGLAAGQVNVKATTTEELGFEGRGEGISCHAVALLLREKQ
jgi:2-C-methyl-D-erythritol 2,4-cyclodiphosphate synthase